MFRLVRKWYKSEPWKANRKPYLTNGTISNVLEWVIEIFNDRKHRAVSLRRSSFFCKFILECKPRRCSSNVNCPSKLTVYAFVFTLRLRIHIPCCCRRLIQSRLRGGRCRVLSLSDRRYSLNPLSQTRIDWVGRDRIRWTFKLSCVWH